jgi:N-acetylmuramoyl-L-alanine amidase
VFGGGNREVELVTWDLAQARHIDQSAVLAGIVEGQLRAKIEVSPLASQQGPMRGLAGVNMPAVMIEMGYLTNPAQDRALKSEQYQTLIVQALTDAVAAFRDYAEGNVGESAAKTEPSPVSPASFGR